MIQLFATIFSVAGTAGFGSMLKLVSGFLASKREAVALKEKRELVRDLGLIKANIEFQKAVFSEGGQSQGSQWTRRILGGIIISGATAIAVYCAMHSTVKFQTFVIPELRNDFSLLWGFVKLPAHKELTVDLTLGHLAIMYMNMASMTVGFYFTPNGKS